MGSLTQTFPNLFTSNFGEKTILTLFSPRVLGRALGKNLGWKPPPFSLWFPLAWVAWSPKFPKLIGRTLSQTTKNLATTQTKGNHREKGGRFRLQPRFSPELPPRNFGQQHAGLKTPQSSLWFPLAWVAWGPKLPKYIGRPGQRKTIGKMGSSAQIFPKSLYRWFWRENNFHPFFPQGLWRELWGKIWAENPPIFPMVSFGLVRETPT